MSMMTYVLKQLWQELFWENVKWLEFILLKHPYFLNFLHPFV